MASVGIIPLLPTSITELNKLVSEDSSDTLIPKKCINTEFDDIPVETRRLKREVSLPMGGVENWGIGDDFETYLKFEDNAVQNYVDTDGIVPEDEYRDRCSSISSVSLFHDDIRPDRNCTVKTFNTICGDSGSTCISSDFSYLRTEQRKDDCLATQETYENLNLFLQEVPEMALNTDTLSSISSPLPSTSSSDGILEFTKLNNYNFDGFSEKLVTGIKRRLDSTNSEDDVFIAKQTKHEYKVEECRYVEIRRKNNIASKNCRKTRKEKQREMEQRVTELEQEKETLRVKIQVLEELIQAHKTCLFKVIGQRR